RAGDDDQDAGDDEEPGEGPHDRALRPSLSEPTFFDGPCTCSGSTCRRRRSSVRADFTRARASSGMIATWPAIIWTPQKNAHPGGGPALLGQASIGRSTAAAQARSA